MKGWLYIAEGKCLSCGRKDWAIGSSAQDAGLLLMHQHAKEHIWYGNIMVKSITKAEASAKERTRQ